MLDPHRILRQIEYRCPSCGSPYWIQVGDDLTLFDCARCSCPCCIDEMTPEIEEEWTEP